MKMDDKEFAIYLGALVFIIIVLLFLWCIPAKALAPEYAASWEKELNFMILKNPKYVMSDKIKPDDPIESGVDCSRYMYLTARRAGIPISRTTARDMATGGGGWLGKDVKSDDADHLDLSFWTWSGSARTYGHVGAFMVGPKSGLLEVTHASETRGVVLDKLKGKLLTDLTKVRRLILGDK